MTSHRLKPVKKFVQLCV